MNPKADTKLECLVEAFLAATEHDKSFHQLDEICKLLSLNQTMVVPISIRQQASSIKRKVALVDAEEEKRSARNILDRNNSLESYEWSLSDYYSQEASFILNTVPLSSIQNIAYIGHGAISTLGLMLEREPEVKHITFYDKDSDMTSLAESIFKKLCPGSQTNFVTQDVFNAQSEMPKAQLSIISNAPLIEFSQTDSALSSQYVFIRSATENGSILYPRFNVKSDIPPSHKLVASKADQIYGIHEFHMLRKISPC